MTISMRGIGLTNTGNSLKFGTRRVLAKNTYTGLQADDWFQRDTKKQTRIDKAAHNQYSKWSDSIDAWEEKELPKALKQAVERSKRLGRPVGVHNYRNSSNRQHERKAEQQIRMLTGEDLYLTAVVKGTAKYGNINGEVYIVDARAETEPSRLTYLNPDKRTSLSRRKFETPEDYIVKTLSFSSKDKNDGPFSWRTFASVLDVND